MRNAITVFSVMQLLSLRMRLPTDHACMCARMLILHCTNYAAALAETGWLQARQEMKRDNDRSVRRVSALSARSYPHHTRLASALIELTKKRPIGFCSDSSEFSDDDPFADRNSSDEGCLGGSCHDWQVGCNIYVDFLPDDSLEYERGKGEGCHDGRWR